MDVRPCHRCSVVLAEITVSQKEGRSQMNRKEFLSAVGSLTTIPTLITVPHHSFLVPKTFAVCFGEPRYRIWSHLIFYNKSPALLPMIADNEQSIPTLLRPMGQRKVILISRLDESSLAKCVSLIQEISTTRKVKVTGLFIYPPLGVDDLSSAIVANCNLRMAHNTLDYVRVANLPDYDSSGAKPQWPLHFYDDRMSDGEKQIVWELLRCYQPETR